MNTVLGFILTTRTKPIGAILDPALTSSGSTQGAKRHVIPRGPDHSYDYRALYRVAAQLKSSYPYSAQVQLTGSAQVEFKDLVHTMDAIRHFSSEDQAASRDTHRRRDMWSRVSFTMP